LEEGGHFLVDTFWPYILGQFGVFGTGCFIWILWRLLVSTLRSFYNNSGLLIKAFALIGVMILVEAILESMAEPIFLKPPQNLLIFAVLGIVRSFGVVSSKTQYENNPN